MLAKEQMEIEESIKKERMEKLQKDKKKSKTVISRLQKPNDDKVKFMDFLKKVGYSGKQLGPMKLSNLLSLYEVEKKKLKMADENKRVEFERAL